MAYFKKIVGDKCYLSPISIDDTELFTEWLNDFEVIKGLGTVSQVITIDSERDFIQDIGKNGKQIFGIVDLKSDKLMGDCGFITIDQLNRKAEFGIFIGDKSFWAKGYGEEATRLILDYGFNILNLHNIILHVYSYNKRAIRVYEKCGFKEIGRRREAKIIAGKMYDEVLMDILDNEFESVFVKKHFE